MKNLLKEHKILLKELEKNMYFLKGSINDYCANCHRARCICEKKTKLRSYRLTYKDEIQKTKTVYIPRDRIKEVKLMLRNYSKIKNILNKLLLLNIKEFKDSG